MFIRYAMWNAWRWYGVWGGTVAAVPPPFRPGNPALCRSHPLVTPYYCRLGDLLCFVFICLLIVFFLSVPSVYWHCWLGLLTCRNRHPYNLYCVGGDVRPCSISQSAHAVGQWHLLTLEPAGQHVRFICLVVYKLQNWWMCGSDGDRCLLRGFRLPRWSDMWLIDTLKRFRQSLRSRQRSIHTTHPRTPSCVEQRSVHVSAFRCAEN